MPASLPSRLPLVQLLSAGGSLDVSKPEVSSGGSVVVVVLEEGDGDVEVVGSDVPVGVLGMLVDVGVAGLLDVGATDGSGETLPGVVGTAVGELVEGAVELDGSVD
jgi:hypothetical protein